MKFLMCSDEVAELRYIASRAGLDFNQCVNDALKGYDGPQVETWEDRGALRPLSGHFWKDAILLEAKGLTKDGWTGPTCRVAVRAHFSQLRKKYGITVPISLIEGLTKGA